MSAQKFNIIFLLAVCISFSAAGETGKSDFNRYWPAWRGPLGTGEAPFGNPPVKWSEQENIAWKIPLQGRGHSTPVIWKNKLFITTAVPLDKPVENKENGNAFPRWMRGRARKAEKVQQFVVMCINRMDGSLIWKKAVLEKFPHAGTHKDGSWAPASCVTDGTHVIVFFGSYGLYCFDMQGTLQWEKDIGDMRTKASFGEGASPCLYGSTLIVNWDHEGPSFLAVFNKSTGKLLWEKKRNERTSWSTPAVAEVNGKPQIIVAAGGASRGYYLKTGDVIWKLGGQTPNVVPTPAVSSGIVYLTSGFRGSILQAVKLAGAQGNLAGTPSILWTYTGGTPYVPSVLVYRDRLYFFQVNMARLTCTNAVTGKMYYEKQRIKELRGVYASPVAADGRIYIPGRNGMTCVLKDGKKIHILAANKLSDRFEASPAIVHTSLYLRGFKNLYCIRSAEKK